MPARPAWHTRVPDILAILRAPGGSPVLDRAAFERLFGVSRRQAIRLMEFVGGGYQAGKTNLVEREAVVAYLSQLSETATKALSRRSRILASLDRNASTEVTIPVPEQQVPGRSLPGGIMRIAPGKLQIEYDSATDLLSRIVALATEAAGDFEGFRRSVE